MAQRAKLPVASHLREDFRVREKWRGVRHSPPATALSLSLTQQSRPINRQRQAYGRKEKLLNGNNQSFNTKASAHSINGFAIFFRPDPPLVSLLLQTFSSINETLERVPLLHEGSLVPDGSPISPSPLASSSSAFMGNQLGCRTENSFLEEDTDHDVGKLDIDVDDRTAHQISHDPWYQVAFVLTTGVNSSYVLGYSGTVMVPLGWVVGSIGLIAAAAISLYANTLLAGLHEVGGKRHIRYRDLAGHVYGRTMYSLTWALQYVNLFMINTGYVILAGQALKAIYVLYRDDSVLKLPCCIVIAGIVCAIFAFGIPHLSALGVWLGFSTFFSFIYIIVALILSFADGIRAPARDYHIPGSRANGIFNSIGAAANLVFAYNTGMLPEIQATLKPPVIKNMQKALLFQFTVGVLPLYAVVFAGYWAYGFSTSSYLLNSVTGPDWVKTLANIASFLQTVIAFHIFASPMYEYLDTTYGGDRGLYSLHSILFRLSVRGGYLAVSTFVAALLPFLGDFMSLTGAFSTFPLTFVLANHMYLKVKGHKLTMLQRSWHWINVVGFSCLAAAAAVSAIRLIMMDSRTYHLFADL